MFNLKEWRSCQKMWHIRFMKKCMLETHNLNPSKFKKIKSKGGTPCIGYKLESESRKTKLKKHKKWVSMHWFLIIESKHTNLHFIITRFPWLNLEERQLYNKGKGMQIYKRLAGVNFWFLPAVYPIWHSQNWVGPLINICMNQIFARYLKNISSHILIFLSHFDSSSSRSGPLSSKNIYILTRNRLGGASKKFQHEDIFPYNPFSNK